MKKNNWKITLSGKEIKKLLRDKLKRTVNYKTKLYKCKILKKCKKIVCTKGTSNKCTKKKNRRIKKKKKGRKRARMTKKNFKKAGRRNDISLKRNQPYFRGPFLDFS